MNIQRNPISRHIVALGRFRLRFALVLVVAAVLGVWLSSGTLVESAHLDAATPELVELAAPVTLVAPSEDDPNTAFPEDEAGFSAYYRIDSEDDTEPRLNVSAITAALLDAPDESNTVRSGPGSGVDLGSNFGVVQLPMFAAVGFGNLVEPRNITVYYDNRGWVVAYLPPNVPAAGIWRHDFAGSDSQETQLLEQNLLVLAINEVLRAADETPKLSPVAHADVGYYDWQNEECNAFLLFSNESGGGSSEPVNFVIPPKIENVLASAAVLLTSRYSSSGPAVNASVVVDGASVVTSDVASFLTANTFNLVRAIGEDNEYETSLHEMSVAVGDSDTATGVVMLLYNKPE